jgi:hypothetical protein
MNVYAEFYPLVVEMLNEFGAKATIRATAPTAGFDKRTGRPIAPPAALADRPTWAVVGPVETEGVDGRRVRETVATMLHEPQQGDTLNMGETTWTLGAVTKVAPQGKAIVYMAVAS